MLDLHQRRWLGAVQLGARWRGLIHWPAGPCRAYTVTIAYVSDLPEEPWLRLTSGIQHLEAAKQPIDQMEVP